MTTTDPHPEVEQLVSSTDPLRLIDVDHVRLYVGKAKQAAYFYARGFGFQIEQVADLTTGSREEASYLLTQGRRSSRPAAAISRRRIVRSVERDHALLQARIDPDKTPQSVLSASWRGERRRSARLGRRYQSDRVII